MTACTYFVGCIASIVPITIARHCDAVLLILAISRNQIRLGKANAGRCNNVVLKRPKKQWISCCNLIVKFTMQEMSQSMTHRRQIEVGQIVP